MEKRGHLWSAADFKTWVVFKPTDVHDLARAGSKTRSVRKTLGCHLELVFLAHKTKRAMSGLSNKGATEFDQAIGQDKVTHHPSLTPATPLPISFTELLPLSFRSLSCRKTCGKRPKHFPGNPPRSVTNGLAAIDLVNIWE